MAKIFSFDVLKNFITIVFILLFSVLGGLLLSDLYRKYLIKVKVDTSRVEKCLNAYINFKKNLNESQLIEELSKINVSKNEFEQIIDRFVQYRINKSALNQAKKLFNALKLDGKIYPKDVLNHKTHSMKNSLHPSLEIEILAIITYKPELVEKAFGS